MDSILWTIFIKSQWKILRNPCFLCLNLSDICKSLMSFTQDSVKNFQVACSQEFFFFQWWGYFWGGLWCLQKIPNTGEAHCKSIFDISNKILRHRAPASVGWLPILAGKNPYFHIKNWIWIETNFWNLNWPSTVFPILFMCGTQIWSKIHFEKNNRDWDHRFQSCSKNWIHLGLIVSIWSRIRIFLLKNYTWTRFSVLLMFGTWTKTISIYFSVPG